VQETLIDCARCRCYSQVLDLSKMATRHHPLKIRMRTKKSKASSETATAASSANDIRPGQSIELLKELHILTRDGKMNQDSRRKLKQVYHLYQFIEPLLEELRQTRADINLVDHGAGKSYLGFILYDLFFKTSAGAPHIYGIETREELVTKSEALAKHLGFNGMSFLNLSVADSITSDLLPAQIDIVTMRFILP
jgi:hypothetical protein